MAVGQTSELGNFYLCRAIRMRIEKVPGFGLDSFCWLVTHGDISSLDFLTSNNYLPLIDVVIS